MVHKSHPEAPINPDLFAATYLMLHVFISYPTGIIAASSRRNPAHLTRPSRP
jgi:hypothetical protein